MIAKGLIVTGAVAALTVGLATPSWAGQNVSAQISTNGVRNVYGAFHHTSDWVQLVDTCGDGRIGYVQVRNGAQLRTYYVAKKGQPHRCGQRWINRNFREGRDVGIRVCLVKGGPDNCTPWRWGIA